METVKKTDVYINNISKRFGDVKAVDDVSFVIKGGEFLTLLGPSGSGKTTLLNLIAGFFRPTSGQIVINDQDITLLPPEKRDVGMTFQNYALFPHMTVEENIAFPLKMRKKTKTDISHRVEEVLHLVRMSGFGQRYPKQLSGGQQQRVSLARSIVFNPSLLLMDEPLGALDKKLRKHMQIELKHLHKQLGMTVVYVTHDQEEALTMSDTIAIMNDGRIEQMGSPDDIYQSPASRFVADFIGESNFLEGKVIEAGPDSARLEVNGRPLVAPLLPWLRKDSEVLIVLRPERLSLHLERPADLRNAFPVLIQEDMYVGNITRYIVHIPELDQSLSVELRNAQDSIRLEPGQKVFVSWRVKDVILVKK
ncbi:MAG: ABC transporter ATP-binding protein [Thermodesulfobacteriota bacterium]